MEPAEEPPPAVEEELPPAPGERGARRVQFGQAGEPERAPRGGADDPVHGEAVGFLEAAHSGLGGGAEFAVHGDVEPFL